MARADVGRADRFGQVAGGAELEGAADDLVILDGGDDHHRDFGVLGAQQQQAGKAVAAGHVEVEQHEVAVAVRLERRGQRVEVAGFLDRHAVAAARERLAQGGAEQRMVVDDDDAAGHGLSYFIAGPRGRDQLPLRAESDARELQNASTLNPFFTMFLKQCAMNPATFAPRRALFSMVLGILHGPRVSAVPADRLRPRPRHGRMAVAAQRTCRPARPGRRAGRPLVARDVARASGCATCATRCAEAEQDTTMRHRDALRSVQRQISRFEEPRAADAAQSARQPPGGDQPDPCEPGAAAPAAMRPRHAPRPAASAAVRGTGGARAARAVGHRIVRAGSSGSKARSRRR